MIRLQNNGVLYNAMCWYVCVCLRVQRHAGTHAHTCMRGAVRPARTRKTALMTAVRSGEPDIVEHIVNAAGVDVNAADKYGYVDVGWRGAV